MLAPASMANSRSRPLDLALLVHHLGLVAAGHQRADTVEHVHEHQCENASEETQFHRPQDIEVKGHRTDVEIQ